jgi:cytochrome c peroxidase
MRKFTFSTVALAVLAVALFTSQSMSTITDYTSRAGHSSLQGWLLPSTPPYPVGNEPNAARVELGKKLFFDPRLSGDGNMSCATCHNPVLGWSDGLPTAKGVRSMVLGRATPTIINSAFNGLQMWDGRKASLEDQAMGPMEATVEMNMDTAKLFDWLRGNDEYRALFEQAYPGEGVTAKTVSKAIATFERTVVSDNSPFDKWVQGEQSAMTPSQVRGFDLFVGKANCEVCHNAPNFSDDGFHNIGLASFGIDEPDVGRYSERPLRLMKGAFKTPTLRDIERTAPYFHDGSAATLMDVVEHYDRGGVVHDNLSPNVRALNLTYQEKHDLVAFMRALTSPFMVVSLPELPQDQ